MAISRAELLKELLPALNELFGKEYEKYGMTSPDDHIVEVDFNESTIPSTELRSNDSNKNE